MSKHSIPDRESAATIPVRQEGQRTAPAAIKLESGEFLIFCPPHVDARHRPAVTLGRLKHGELVLHFRVYKRNGRGRYAITSVGCSFKPNELHPIFAKLNELAAVLPELAEALRQGEGSC